VLETEQRVQLQLEPIKSCYVVDSMPTTFLYLNFLGCLVYRPCLGMGPHTLHMVFGNDG
jgi:hypothetical protein